MHTNISRFLLPLLALPLLADAAPATDADSTPSALAMWHRDFRFTPMDAAQLQELRHAVTACQAVELGLLDLGPKGKDGPLWTRRLTRGEELDAILARLAAVPQWYIGSSRILSRVPRGRVASLRFEDAAGQVLLELHACSNMPASAMLYVALPGAAAPPHNLVDYFPFPPRPWSPAVNDSRVSFTVTDEQELHRIAPGFGQDALPGDAGASLCRVNEQVAVIGSWGGSGLYVSTMQVYLRPAEAGAWQRHPEPLRHSTGSAAHTPGSCGVKDNILTIYDREGHALRSLDLSAQAPTNKLSKKEALEKGRAALLRQHKDVYDKLMVVDHGDYYTVTPELPPFTLGGGWTVDLDSRTGDILKVYFTE